MGKQGTTMAIGHATAKYGNYGQERASMDNYGQATGKTFLVRMSMCLWEWNTPLGKV